jgi:hypothetical protein
VGVGGKINFAQTVGIPKNNLDRKRPEEEKEWSLRTPVPYKNLRQALAYTYIYSVKLNTLTYDKVITQGII